MAYKTSLIEASDYLWDFGEDDVLTHTALDCSQFYLERFSMSLKKATGNVPLQALY